MCRALAPQRLQLPPSTSSDEIAALKAIDTTEDVAAARDHFSRLVEKLCGLRLARAAELVEAAAEKATLGFSSARRDNVRTLVEGTWLGVDVLGPSRQNSRQDSSIGAKF